jgi:hypothetical protein
VYGMAGHWSRLATAPEIELVMITGSTAGERTHADVLM